MPSLSGFFTSSPTKKSASKKARQPSTRPSSSKKPGASPKTGAHTARRTPSPHYPDLSSKNHPRSRSSYEHTHPLNLPPIERERRLSAMSTGSAGPSTPEESDPVHQNGSSDSTADADTIPTPPPHRSPTPPAEPAVDPEDHKNLGNKYFKARDYVKAVTEYTKGMCLVNMTL